MSKPRKLLKDCFTEDFHTPNTEEVRKYLEENFETITMYSDKKYISSTTWSIRADSKFQTRDRADGKFIDTETFKEIIGMTNKSNEMPELVAGRHFVKLKSGEYAMVMDGYWVYFNPSETGGFRNTNFTYTDHSKVSCVVEVFDCVKSHGVYFSVENLSSGKYTIWKKQEKTQQQIELEALGEQIAALQKQYEALKQASSE